MATRSTPLSPADSPEFLFSADSIVPSSFSSPPQPAESVFFDDFAAASFDTSQETFSGLKDLPVTDPGPFHQNYAGSMTDGVNSRVRKMSQSSNEREMSTDVKLPPRDDAGDAEI